MKHLVMGQTGNLGVDLQLELKAQGHQAFNKFTAKLEHPVLINIIKHQEPDVIWLPIGSGSIGGDFKKQLDASLTMLMDLEKVCPKAKIITFSTSFIADPSDPTNPKKQGQPKSLYALSKKMMEDYILVSNNPNLKCIRVTNLYGKHYPEKCFPYKIANDPNVKILATNEVVPTPTNELAKKLVENFDKIINSDYPILHAAPKGSCSIAAWGRLIKPEIEYGSLDPLRPPTCAIGSFFEWENWQTLWEKNKYGND